jgi:hypothetical protein
MQTRRHSFYESVVKVSFGLCYSIPLNYVLINKVQWSDPWTQSVAITLLFTILSISFSYVWRRIFNWLTIRDYLRQLEEYPHDRTGDDHLG